MRNPFLVDRMQGFGTTIFAEMSALAGETGSINLGQGFPDTDGPPEVVDAAIAAIRAGENQYPPGIGIESLRTAVAEHQHRFWGLSYDPDDEILVTAGATEAIAAALLALLEVGDEVVVFEPYYDSYTACIALAGAQHRCVTLRPPDYSFTQDALRAAITPRTRVVLLNTPHNPTGKVFSRSELESIAAAAIEHDLLVITDEVYEHLVYEGAHIPIATLPGMRERTLSISSAGKSFSMTGWKTGWICARPGLVAAVRTVKQFLTYTHAAPFQHAAAAGLRLHDEYFAQLVADMAAKRDLLTGGLVDAGFDVHPSAGTYFVTADIRPFGESDGMSFCQSLPARCGVVAIPTVVFYDDVEVGAPLVRFMFGKRRAVLEEAVRRLKALA